MNILLINPPRSPFNAIRTFAPEAAKRFIHKKLIGPPLGLLTVAAAVRHHDVTVLDMKAEYDCNENAPDMAELAIEYCKKTSPAIVGITVIASEFDSSIAILKAVKQYDKNILTVAGGLHPTLCPTDFAGSAADIICIGQASHTFADIALALETKKNMSTLSGCMLNTKSGLIPTTGKPVLRNYATKDFLMPDRSLIRQWLPAYLAPGGSGQKATYLFTSLGCPFKCSFCSIWPQWDGGFFLRDIESIISELRTLTDYGVVRFADANSVIDADYARRLFDRINQEGLNKFFIMDIRCDTAANNPDLIAHMAKAGLKVVICGFESFRQNELAAFNKQLDAANIKKAISIFHENGIMIRGNYVVSPDYDDSDFDALAEFANAEKVTYAGYTVLTPMPGTSLYSEMKDQIIDHDLRKYNFFNCVLKTKLPLQTFHEKVGALWLVKKGSEII